MVKNSHNNFFLTITKSKFVRSIFLKIVAIFLIFIIAIIAIVFFSFTSEINRNILAERQKQLDTIEDTISKRMEEISSIAYNIGKDKSFYLEAVTDDKNTGYEMSNTLERYLVGNDFIEHLAYYRLSEPNTIYASSGQLSFRNFWSTYLGVDDATAQEYIKRIQNTTKIELNYISLGTEKQSFFSYICPLPQFSQNPQAYVLMLIPISEVKPILESQLTNCYGDVAILDETGTEIYHMSNLKHKTPLSLSGLEEETYFTHDGERYILQTTKSSSNSWTYVSAIRLNDIVSKVAYQQIIFIILLLVLMLAAIFTMLMYIIKEYKPISNLARTFEHIKDDDDKSIIDEESLLSNTFASLKDDSEQKQKFETAYHEAEAASKAKSTFLSNMSHDIRTPMNAIIGMTEIAANHADNPSYVKECLQNVQVASQYLLDIINNVLDMSRIESGKFSLCEDVVDFLKLIHGIVTILNHSLEVKSQKLMIHIKNIYNEKIIGDSVRLAQVFMNILSNSVKFTPNGGTIRFHMEQKKSVTNGYGDYVFIFSDTGIGMDPAFVRHVFDTFTRDEQSGISKIEGT